ncbi:hypothetical protein AAG906_012983 [Vitis piasezkii]
MVPPILLDVSHYYNCGLGRDSTWVAPILVDHPLQRPKAFRRLDHSYRMRHCYMRVYQLIR